MTAKNSNSISFSFFDHEKSPPTELPSKTIPDPPSPIKQDQLVFYQAELKSLESQLEKVNKNVDSSNLEMRMDQIRNIIATIRGEIAINESTKTTKILNNIMVSIKRETGRVEKNKRAEMMEIIKQKFSNNIKTNNFVENVVPIKPKPLEVKVFDSSEKNNRLIRDNKIDKDDFVKITAEARNKSLIDKEKELAQKEAFLQQTWMRVPGAKELIENLNLTIVKLNCEKQVLDKERDEFEREKIEWLRNKDFNSFQKKFKNKG